MSKTFGVTIVVTTTHTFSVIAKAPDIHDAVDLADDFARKNLTALLDERAVFSGRSVEAYSSRAIELIGAERVDVEA